MVPNFCNSLLFAFIGLIMLESPAFAGDSTDDALGKRRPNIVMIAIDDLNDWVEPLGGHPQTQTPAMSALAQRGMVFTNAHCQSPLCNPSRTSLLTSRRPSTSGVYGLAPWIRQVPELRDLVTLPQHFQKNGYRTLAGGKIFHGNYGRDSSDEMSEWGPVSSIGITPDKKLIPPTPMGNHPLMDWGTFPHQDEQKGDWKVASWAVDQLEHKLQVGEQPFFLSVGFFLPHVPCYVTQKWFDLYPEDTTVLAPSLANDRDDVPRSAWYIHWKLPEPRTKWLIENNQLLNLTRSYLASISFVDSQVARVLSALENSQHADNTIVVLWSDHGYHLGEKDISGKNSLWQRSTRVPLILAGPGIMPGQSCSQPAELLDVFPTLADLCGLDMPDQLEGISLRPQLADPSQVRVRPAITTHNPNNHSVCSERYRFIQYADGGEEFYDRQLDPQEWTNLAGDQRYQQLIAQHRAWLPKTSLPPVAGSAHRILVREGDSFLWEGELIDPEHIPE